MLPTNAETLRRVMQVANQEAIQSGNGYVGTHDVLVAIVAVGSGPGADLLRARGLDAETVRSAIDANREFEEPEVDAAIRLIKKAMAEARRLDHLTFDVDHVLLAVADDPLCYANVILAGLGVDVDQIRAEIRGRLIPGPPGTFAHREGLAETFRDHPHVRELSARIEQLQTQLEKAVANADFVNAATFRDERRSIELQRDALYQELDRQSQ